MPHRTLIETETIEPELPDWEPWPSRAATQDHPYRSGRFFRSREAGESAQPPARPCGASTNKRAFSGGNQGTMSQASRSPRFDCCSGHENGGAFKLAGAEVGECLVGLAERVAPGVGDDADLRDQPQEIESILPREIGDRHELPLFPEKPIGKARDIAHMDARQNDAPALAHAF